LLLTHLDTDVDRHLASGQCRHRRKRKRKLRLASLRPSTNGTACAFCCHLLLLNTYSLNYPHQPPIWHAYVHARAARRTIRVPFLTNQHAQFAMRAIEVDKERQPQAVRRVLSVEDRDLVACVLFYYLFTLVFFYYSFRFPCG
jgi:hypothetical protein